MRVNIHTKCDYYRRKWNVLSVNTEASFLKTTLKDCLNSSDMFLHQLPAADVKLISAGGREHSRRPRLYLKTFLMNMCNSASGSTPESKLSVVPVSIHIFAAVYPVAGKFSSHFFLLRCVHQLLLTLYIHLCNSKGTSVARGQKRRQLKVVFLVSGPALIYSLHTNSKGSQMSWAGRFHHAAAMTRSKPSLVSLQSELAPSTTLYSSSLLISTSGLIGHHCRVDLGEHTSTHPVLLILALLSAHLPPVHLAHSFVFRLTSHSCCPCNLQLHSKYPRRFCPVHSSLCFLPSTIIVNTIHGVFL